MRICSPQLGISPQSILGGEIYDRELLKQFAKKGIECEIILPFGKPHEKVKNWYITHIPIPFVVPPHLYNLYVLPYLFWIYKKRPFDILRIHSPTFLGFAALIFKKVYPHVPIIGTYHWLGEGGRMEKIMDPYLLKMFDVVICDSRAMQKQIETQFPFTKGKVYAIHNGVDEALKPKPRTKKSTITLLYMGLFIARKNPLFLLKILKKLVNQKQDIKLIFCGRGPLEYQIRKTVEALNLQNYVKVIAPVYGKEKNNLFNSADIFVHPAKNEGFPLAVIEAMVCGLPVVITNGFSAREAVKYGENGFLCKSINDWKNKLEILIKNKTLRVKMGKESYRIVKNEFSWRLAGEKQLELFKNVSK